MQLVITILKLRFGAKLNKHSVKYELPLKKQPEYRQPL